MKKKISVVILILFVFIISGCGNTKELECNLKNNGNNMNAYGDIKYTFKDDKIVSQHSVIEFKDITVPNIDQVWDTFVQQFTEQNQPVEEVGYKRTVKSDDKNHIFTVILDVDYSKITKEVMEKYGINEEEVFVSYDDMKQSMLENKDIVSCK